MFYTFKASLRVGFVIYNCLKSLEIVFIEPNVCWKSVLVGIYKIENNTTYYTIVTTEAKGIMREIHNSKLRMPVAFQSDEKMNDWIYKVPVEPDWDFIGVEV